MPQAVRVALMLVVVGLWAYLCLAPSDDISPPIINDKLAHFIGNFGVAGVVFIAGITRQFRYVFLLVFLYSFGIECVQGFLPSRYFSFLDILANAAGIVVALLLMHYLQHRRLLNVIWF